MTGNLSFKEINSVKMALQHPNAKPSHFNKVIGDHSFNHKINNMPSESIHHGIETQGLGLFMLKHHLNELKNFSTEHADRYLNSKDPDSYSVAQMFHHLPKEYVKKVSEEHDSDAIRMFAKINLENRND